MIAIPSMSRCGLCFIPPSTAFLVDPDQGATIAFDDNVRSRFASGWQILSSP
jgi:hypothetical protein